MPVSGCPIGKGFSWQTGYRYQDMEYDIVQDNKVEHWSPGMLLKGNIFSYYSETSMNCHPGIQIMFTPNEINCSSLN